ncbi:MAG: iron ABC transporter permease, partial [Algiphilus sp.]|nr:iron ABC transporter permease [Algiphilus sp.]
MHALRCLLVLTPLALLALGVAVIFGSVPLSLADTITVITGGGEPLHRTMLLELRLPRALSAFAVGGLLSVAGALMQVLLRNPLADPYVLGLSGGAAVGALLAMLAGLGVALVSGAAFIGALVSTAIVFGTAHGTGSWTPTRLL